VSDQKELIRDRREAERREAEHRDAERREAERRDLERREAERRPAAEAPEALLGADTAGFRQEWEAIQAGFVDEPRQAVERADGLVARAAQRLTEVFAHERQRLEEQWSRGDSVSTEDLRVALRRYRSFFDRLLSI
jgi:hypothetical protein